MEHKITVFSNSEFGQIRTLMIDGEPWFVAKDISEKLGYNKTNNMRKLLDADDVRLIDPQSLEITSLLQNGACLEPNKYIHTLLIVNESGLYTAIINSTLPGARKFKRWVTSEVLPSLRKNGGYIVGQEEMSQEELVAKALVVANNIIAKKDKRIKELEPKGEYFDALVESRLLTNLRDTAKELHIEPQRFNQWLVDHSYVYRDKHNMIKPYQEHVKAGLFEIKDFTTFYGYSNTQTFITVKGKETFRLLLMIEPEIEEGESA